jgi:hypothetical protein
VADQKTCRRCGTQYTPSVIDVCPSCGAPAGAAGTAAEAAAEDTAHAASQAPHSGAPAPVRARRGGGPGLLSWLGTLVLMAVATGAVLLAFGSEGDDEPGVTATAQTAGTATAEETRTTATQPVPTKTTTVSAGGAAALVKLAPVRARDRGCLARWNARRNRAVRRKAFVAATGGRRVASVQLVPPGQATAPLHCVVLVGVQPRRALSPTPGRIYVEVLPFTAAPSRWIRLGTAFLSYQWNARMRAGGRLDAARR